MNGRTLFLALGLLCGAVAVTGCSNGQPRFKGLDSYANATMTNTYGPTPDAGMDPYSFGGTAYATGGLEPGVSYGTGADDPFDGDPAHFAEIIQYNGSNTPPVDWGDGKGVDSSGIVVPEPPKPIED